MNHLKNMANHYGKTNEIELCDDHLKVFLNNQERAEVEMDLLKLIKKLEKELSYGLLVNTDTVLSLANSIKSQKDFLQKGYIVFN